MTVTRGTSAWCIHGAPYGPDWSCYQCQGGQPSNAPGGVTLKAPENPWTEERVARVIRLLEAIEYAVRTRR